MMALSRPNKIYFHFSNKKINYIFFIFLLILSFSTINSIEFVRSLSVQIYLILFILLGIKSFFLFSKKTRSFSKNY